jgi:hypothetical protein
MRSKRALLIAGVSLLLVPTAALAHHALEAQFNTQKTITRQPRMKYTHLRAWRTNVNDEDVIKVVRLRYRVCNYLFTLGAAWYAIGAILGLILRSANALHARYASVVAEVVGAGIFSAAFAVTLAIYRCPVCDHFLSRFFPRKDQCQHCGAKVR